MPPLWGGVYSTLFVAIALGWQPLSTPPIPWRPLCSPLPLPSWGAQPPFLSLPSVTELFLGQCLVQA